MPKIHILADHIRADVWQELMEHITEITSILFYRTGYNLSDVYDTRLRLVDLINKKKIEKRVRKYANSKDRRNKISKDRQ